MSSSLFGCRVLLVEDEMIVAWELEDVLSGWGCTIVGPVGRVGKALSMVDAGAIDMAVLDISLNGERSYSVADALQARGVPFVFLTGYSRSSLPSRYQSYLMLQKPFEKTELGNVLTQMRASGG